jgi:hypothetical protein
MPTRIQLLIMGEATTARLFAIVLADTSIEICWASAAPPQSMAKEETRTPASAQPIRTSPAASASKPACPASNKLPTTQSARLADKMRLAPNRRQSEPAQNTINSPLEIAVQRSKFTCMVVMPICSRRSSNTNEIPMMEKVLNSVASKLTPIGASSPAGSQARRNGCCSVTAIRPSAPIIPAIRVRRPSRVVLGIQPRPSGWVASFSSIGVIDLLAMAVLPAQAPPKISPEPWVKVLAAAAPEQRRRAVAIRLTAFEPVEAALAPWRNDGRAAAWAC